jgi:outer membrane lipoprotein-sorting protein
MRRRKASLILLLVIWFGPASAMGEGQDRDPESQLLRLFEAIERAKTEARYEAEQTVYAFTGEKTVVTRFRVQYAYPYRKRECIEGPEESRVIVLEDGKHQWSYFPARKLVVKEPLRDEDSPFPLCLTEDLNFLAKNYQFQVVGPVLADGVQCRIVSFIPRSSDRPRREWWLEESRNVPIRVNVSSSDGRPAYMTQLQDIRWDADLEPDAFRLRVPKDTRVHEVREQENLTIEDVRRLLNRPVVLPLAIPAGYRQHDMVLRSEGSRQCLQIIYTDGLSSVSFFRAWTHPGKGASHTPSELSVDQAPSVPSSRVLGLMNVVTLEGPGGRTVIVGDVDKDRLMEMAESLRAANRELISNTLGESFPEDPPATP